MKKILVPTDFSQNADKALNYAVEIARRTNAAILLIHAVEIAVNDDDFKNAKEKLEQIEQSIISTELINVSSRVFSNSPVNSILEAITENKIDLVIMGTLGSSGIKEVLYGSHTAAIIGKSPVPVLAIPLLSDWSLPCKILLATKMFDAEDKMMNSVTELAVLFNSEIQLTVFTDTDDDYVEDYNLHENKIAELRDSLKTKYPQLKIHAVHLAGKNFRQSLQHWIDENKIDMLAMLTHKRSFLENLFNRSVTKKISYQTNIPLLSIPISR